MNISLITCILRNQGYFGHFDYLMIFYCRGVPRGPHTPLVELCWSLSGKEEASWQRKDIKQSLPFLVKGRKRQIWSIFPKEEKLAPHSNSNLEASLRAFLGAQSIGEKGENLDNASRPH